MNNEIGDVQLAVVWNPHNATMDTSNPPMVPKYTFYIDGIEREIGTMDWPGGNAMQVYAAGAAAVTSMKLVLDNIDKAVLNSNGVVATAPQEQSVDVP